MLTTKIIRPCTRCLSLSAVRFQDGPTAISTLDEACNLDNLKQEHIFTEEHIALRRSLRQLIKKEITPHIEEWEKSGKFLPAHKVMKILGNAGFLGVNRHVEYGGLGLDYSYNFAVAEELGGMLCTGVGMAIGVQTDMATPALARFGSDELKKKFLAPTISGDMVACIGISELEAGSDVANILTTATKDGDDYIINGGKMWITSGMQADWMCCLANTSKEPGYHNKSLICLPLDSPGVVRARAISKIGTHSTDTAQLFFDNVRVPQNNLIGEEGKGFIYQMLQFQEERLWGAASVLLQMDIAIAETIKYCSERKAFGKSILDNQVVHFRLAELKTEVESLRSLLYRTVDQYVNGNNVTMLASMAKLKAGRLLREVTDSCLQYWGGMGYTDETMISTAFKDGRLLSIAGGADEIMLGIICKYMGTLPGSKNK